METKVKQINGEISGKGAWLKDKANTFFAGIYIPVSRQITPANTEKKGTPPISYILYGLAGLAVINGFAVGATFGKLCSFGVAAASAYGGHKLSKNTPQAAKPNTVPTGISFPQLKNEVTAKVIDAVKKTSEAWENFMELKQKEIQGFIQDANDLSAAQKDALISKIYLYEIIDIRLVDFSSLANTANNAADLRTAVDAYKTKLFAAIDLAVNKQTAKYQSLLQA
ncbi:MAG: hypothetical protein LBL81_01340 [Tannerella sp.]|jgi:hypothetical protein|nr:hypothetical protein [Tannerella sp.]